VCVCLPRLPNEIFVAFISSGFNFRRNERSEFNRGGKKTVGLYLFNPVDPVNPVKNKRPLSVFIRVQ